MRYMRLGLSQVRICRPPPLSFAPIFMKDVHSAESNEKYIFRYLFFELWLIVFTIYQKITDHKKKLFRNVQICRKNGDCSENYFLVPEFFLCDFYFLRYGRFQCAKD